MPTPEDVEGGQGHEAKTTDLAQAYRDLARGEDAASAIEANLSRLESKLDAMLDAVEPDKPAPAPAVNHAAPPGPSSPPVRDKLTAQGEAHDQSRNRAAADHGVKPQPGQGETQP